jgi:hypothetical protein
MLLLLVDADADAVRAGYKDDGLDDVPIDAGPIEGHAKGIIDRPHRRRALGREHARCVEGRR